MNRTRKIVLPLILCAVIAIGAHASGADEKAAGPASVSLPYTGEEVVFTYFSEGTEDYASVETVKPTWQAIQEKIGNVKIEFHGATKDEEDTRLALMYASGLEFDMIRVREPLKAIPPIAASGILLDFSEYPMPNLKKAAMTYPMLDIMVDKDGGRFALHTATSGDRPYLLTVANTTLFDKYNQNLPVKTSDDWLKVIAEQQAADPSIISVGDIWSGAWNITWVLGGMFNAGRAVQFWGYDFDKGTWYYGPADPDHGFKETMMWMNECYELGGFHDEWLTYTLDQYTAFMQEGNWAVMDTYAYAFSQAGPDSPMKNRGDYEIDYFTIPKGPTGANEAMGGAFFDGAPYWGVAADADTDNPALLAAILDLSYSDEMIEIANWGLEGVTFVKGADGKNKWAPGFPSGEDPAGTKVFADYFTSFAFLGGTKITKIGVELTKNYNQYSMPVIEKWAAQLADGTMTGARVSWTGETAPQVTAEEGERVGEEMTPITTHVQEMMVSFITGKRGFDEWDDFQKELRQLGDLNWVVDLYNSYPTPVVQPRDWDRYFD